MDAHAVADALAEVARLLEATGAPAYRVRAYERAGRVIDALPPGDLERRVADARLEELPAIGAALAKKITTLARTGTLPELTELRSQVPRGFRELSRIEGLGPKRILALHHTLGVETIEDLVQAIAEHRLREVRGFSAALEARLGERIAAAREQRSRHLWLAAVRETEHLSPRLAAAGAGAVAVAGEARRAHEEVEGLELVAVADDPEDAAERFLATGGLLEPARRERARVAGTSADGLPVDVRFAQPAHHPAALLVATGPDAHVEALVARAADLGLDLGPRGLLGPEGRPVELADEVDLYARLGLAFVPPELRDDPDALEQAQAGRPFEDLLRVEDVQGHVHCHSTWSDGRDSIEAMARACDALGVAYLTITDHSASAGYANGLDEDRLRRQWDEIDAVQERVRVRLLKGTEADILADGSLDWPDRVLERMDVVVASVHQRHRMDPVAMTDRLVRAMRHPCFKIWGHGLGRLVGRRDPIACDVERVLDEVAASPAAVEINADPHRLDLAPEWIRAARSRGVPLVVSVDAHSVSGLSALPFGVGIARRAGVRRGEVLNTRSVERFRAAVSPARTVQR